MDSSLPLQSLLERLKGATGPDREIDLAVLLACGCKQIQPPPFELIVWPNGGRVWPGGPYRDRLPVTASVDAALALVTRVLPGWNASAILLHEAPCEGHVWEPGHAGSIQGKGATPALALLAALLQALIASKSPSETGE